MIFDRYRAHFEAELVKQELLLKGVIADKERIIQRQDEDIKLLRAKCERLELLVIPGLRPAQTGNKIEPRKVAPEGETSWTGYLRRHMEEEEKAAKEAKEQANGVHGQERSGIHQSTSSDAQRQNGGNANREPQTANGEA